MRTSYPRFKDNRSDKKKREDKSVPYGPGFDISLATVMSKYNIDHEGIEILKEGRKHGIASITVGNMVYYREYQIAERFALTPPTHTTADEYDEPEAQGVIGHPGVTGGAMVAQYDEATELTEEQVDFISTSKLTSGDVMDDGTVFDAIEAVDALEA